MGFEHPTIQMVRAKDFLEALLNLDWCELRLESPFAIQLRGLDVGFTLRVVCLEDDAIRRQDIVVSDFQDVSNVHLVKAFFNEVTLSILIEGQLSRNCAIELLVFQPPLDLCNQLLDNAKQNNKK